MSTEASNFKSKDFALRAQKKILSQLSSRKAVKVFINENLSNLLDLLYQLIKTHTKDKKVAEKFAKNLIKLSIKIGILTQNDQCSDAEEQIAHNFTEMLRTMAKTIASFIEVDFTYDRKFLLTAVSECEVEMKSLVQNHLTDKSLSRITFLADHLRDTSLLDSAFTSGTPLHAIMVKIVEEINKALDNGDL